MDTLLLTTCLIAAAVGGLAGPLLVRLAHRRALAQPLDLDADAERRVLGAALAEPAWLSEGEELLGSDFAAPERGIAWEAARAAFTEHGDALTADSLRTAVLAAVAEHVDTETAQDVVAQAQQAWADSSGARREYLLSGETVMARHEDRTIYGGRGATVRADDGSFHRQLDAPSSLRTGVVAVMTAASFGVLPWLTSTVSQTGSLAWGLAVLTGVLMVVMGVLVSLVDIDTLRIDLGLFAAFGVASWGSAAASAWAASDLGRVIVAGAATLVIVGLFELLNFIHKRIRGIDGQGFGDTLLALVTVGVPVALADSALLAYWALMVAVGAVLVTYVVRRLRGEPSEQAKLNPFGPYLAGSWVLAWTGIVAGVLPSLV